MGADFLGEASGLDFFLALIVHMSTLVRLSKQGLSACRETSDYFCVLVRLGSVRISSERVGDIRDHFLPLHAVAGIIEGRRNHSDPEFSG